MIQAPFDQISDLRIGAVDFVSPVQVKATLDTEAPESVALNAGLPRPFPRVNSYLLIPVDDVFLVGQVDWLTVERSAFPQRRGMRDFGLIDLPYPLRKLSLTPLGTLASTDGEGGYSFRRGTAVLPTIGSPLLLPSAAQLSSIVESGEDKRVMIGTSPLANNAEVWVDPNRLFGRHLAILGNTGSGKSCTVAGLIDWSLAQARSKRGSQPNARFIVLDPNGEYTQAFTQHGQEPAARVFKVNARDSAKPLKVPLWFWTSEEWASFTQASARTQRPLMKRALRDVRAGRTTPTPTSEEELKLRLRRYLTSRLISMRAEIRSGSIQSKPTPFGSFLEAVAQDLDAKRSGPADAEIMAILSAIRAALEAKFKSFTDRQSGEVVEYYRPFTEAEVQEVVDALSAALDVLGGVVYEDGPDEDAPLPFEGTDLADHLELLAAQENVTQYLDFLVARIRTMLANARMKAITSHDDSLTLQTWLTDYIGANDAAYGAVSVIDLSLVPSEITHVVAAVVARMVFEASQRYMNAHEVPLPTVLVMEEAHTFIRRYRHDAEQSDPATISCQVFERIAREGRKFGLGLVLSSQRPSELSPTVLSQCNSFLLHRITNDRDQELVNRLVPDNLRGLLGELPSLPSQTAILLGWASELPVLVRINDLSPDRQPRSADPGFWEVWVGQDEAGREVARPIDWAKVAEHWQDSPVDTRASEDSQGEDASTDGNPPEP